MGYDADAADFDEDGLTDILAVGYTSIYWYSVSRFDNGWLESSILDVRGYPQWDSLTWIATEPSGTDMYFRVRSSNDPEELGAWSDRIQSQGSLAGYMDSTHRFMQYRVHMESPERSGTPFIDRVVFYYSNLGVEEEEEGSFLLQVVPNPSAGSATVKFELLEESVVELGIYDLAGRLVRIPAEGPHSSGLHEIVVSDLPSGVYVARVRAGRQLASERFVVVR
ncbi:T9SS type A sorting domain-containing protein [Candidatus Fermentibacteria bacterium]|nr:T9SS type A sorting domain-containing protein [Candidatus Fermentibacteria bacterium]